MVIANLYIAFLVSGAGNSVYSIMVLARVSDRLHDDLYNVFRFIQNIGPSIWKTTFLAIIVERAAATIFCKTYEKRAPIIFGVVLFLLGLMGALISVSYFIYRIPYVYTIYVNAILDITGWIFVLVLFWVNQKMRSIRFDATIHLSYRYQNTENVRFLRVMTPLIIIAGFIDTLAMVLYTIQTSIDFNTLLYYPATMLTTNVYILVYHILYFLWDEKTRRKIIELVPIRSPTVMPSPTHINNSLGKPLVVKDDPEMHFMQLNKYWS